MCAKKSAVNPWVLLLVFLFAAWTSVWTASWFLQPILIIPALTSTAFSLLCWVTFLAGVKGYGRLFRYCVLAVVIIFVGSGIAKLTLL